MLSLRCTACASHTMHHKWVIPLSPFTLVSSSSSSSSSSVSSSSSPSLSLVVKRFQSISTLGEQMRVLKVQLRHGMACRLRVLMTCVDNSMLFSPLLECFRHRLAHQTIKHMTWEGL